MNKQIVYLICIAILFLAERGMCIPRWFWIDCFPQWTSHQENPSAQPRFPSAFECFFFEILKKMTKKEIEKELGYEIEIKDTKENSNEIVDYLKRHLDKYGNTTINKKKKKYLKVLIEQGYKIKTKPSIYDKNSIIVELDKNEWY